MPARHIMVDIETFSTSPGAALVEIAALRFHPLDCNPIVLGSAHADAFARTIALQSSVLAGGAVDQETVAWWRAQGANARGNISRQAIPLQNALAEFAAWYNAEPVAGVWSHGAAFDVPVIDSAYRRLGQKAPWDHRAVRDTRTLFWLAGDLAGWERPAGAAEHLGLRDALAQAEMVRTALCALMEATGLVRVK